MPKNSRTYPSPCGTRSPISRPYVSAILLALLLADAYLIAQPQLVRGYSTVGLLICQHILHQHPAPVQPAGPTRTVFALQPSGDFQIFHPDEDSTWDRVHDAYGLHRGQVVMFAWRPITLSRGLWAPTLRMDRHILAIHDGDALTAEQRAAARRQFVEQSGAAAWLSRPDFQTLTTTDIDRTRPIPLGYLHNTLAAAALVLLLLSLRWVPQTPAYIRAHIARSRLSRGLCPRCSYNLHGLREPKCPECGERIDASRAVPHPTPQQ